MEGKHSKLSDQELNETQFQFTSNFETADSVITETTELEQQSDSKPPPSGGIVGGEEYKLYCYRHVILIIYCLVEVVMAMMMVSFSAAGVQIASILGVNVNLVNMCMGVYIFASVFSIPGNYINDKYGFHIGLYTAMLLFLVGAWLRVFIETSIWFALLGCSLGGFAFAISMAPGKVSATWFSNKEVGFRTTIMTAMVPLGAMISFALPAIFIDSKVLDKVTPNPKTGETKVLSDQERALGTQGILNEIIFQNILFTVVIIPAFLFWRRAPPTPPSATSNSVDSGGFCESARQLFKIRNYVLLMLVFNVVWGIYGTIGAVVSSFTGKFGFGASDNTIFSICFVMVGMIGSIFVGSYLDRSKRFRFVHTRLTFLLLVMLVLQYFFLKTEKTWVVAPTIGIIGFCVIPFLPVSFEYGAELTFPQGQAFMGGILYGVSQLFSSLLLIIVQALIDVDVRLFFAFLAALVSIAFVISLFITQDLRRLKHQSSGQSETMMKDTSYN